MFCASRGWLLSRRLVWSGCARCRSGLSRCRLRRLTERSKIPYPLCILQKLNARALQIQRVDFDLASKQRQQLDRNIELFRLDKGPTAEFRIVRNRQVVDLESWWQQPQMHVAQCDFTIQTLFELSLHEPVVLIYIHERPHSHHRTDHDDHKATIHEPEFAHNSSSNVSAGFLLF